jgi:hypothetical protein
MNVVKRISWGIFASFYIFTNVLIVFPAKVSALNGNEEAKYDLDVAIAYQILLACTEENDIHKNDYNKVRWAQEGLTYPVPAIWESGAKNMGTTVSGEIKCDETKDIGAVLKVMGIGSVNEYNELIAPKSGEGSSCSGDNCDFRSNWKTVLAQKIDDVMGRPGPDNSLTDVSLAGQYYFWAKTFKDGRCKGNVYKQQSSYDNKPEDQRTKGPIYWFENGAVTEMVGAGYKKVEPNVAFDDLGQVNYFDQNTIRTMITQKNPEPNILSLFGDPALNTGYTCKDIINKLKDKKYAQAYADLIAEKGGGNMEFNDVFDENSEGDNAETCESRTLLSSGWIVCTLLELLADGMESMFSVVEGLLNIDAQKLYDDQELRTSWSYFRAIATFALIAVGLVMIISQAIGGGN